MTIAFIVFIILGFALIVSTSSWLGALGGIISHISKEFNSNKRANW